MLHKTTGFTIAFVIVFMSAISAYSAQADNLVSLQSTALNHSHEVVHLSKYEPSNHGLVAVITTDKSYSELKDQVNTYRVLLVSVGVILAVISTCFIALAVFLLSRPKYFRNK